MTGRKVTAAVGVMVCVLLVGVARADTIYTKSTEYTNRIKTAETIQPLGETPFGEQISLGSGSLGFRQTDISYPGIGPTITLTRTYDISGSPLGFLNNLPMGDWDLSVPQIATIVPGMGPAGETGRWIVEGGDELARCSSLTPISQKPYAYSRAWWHGYQLVTGDGNSQGLLLRTPENALAPGANPAAYPLITMGHWMISCLPQTANGMGGEAFLATSPDGTRYWFDHLAYGGALETLIEYETDTGPPQPPRTLDLTAGSADDALVAGTATPDPGSDIYWGLATFHMPRKRAHMLVTRVEDRFGNWLTYHYNGVGQLQQVKASDGRLVDVIWRTDAPVIDRIRVQPDSPLVREWRYEYQNVTATYRTLWRVYQPDGNAWLFDMMSASNFRVESDNPDGACYVRGAQVGSPEYSNATVSIGHPSGLWGQFDLSIIGRSRSWVPTECAPQGGQLPPAEFLATAFRTLAITRKTFSGAGVAPAVWTYRYSPAAGSTVKECLASGCVATQWTEVVDPSGAGIRYIFSNRHDVSEGRLLETIAGISTPGQATAAGLQVDRSGFAASSQGPFPSRVGSAITDGAVVTNNAPSEEMTLENLHETVRQGVTFSRATTRFDRFGQPEAISRWSTLGYGSDDTTSYWPVGSPWVLGQVAQTASDGVVMEETQYDARMLPVQTREFGLLKHLYAWHADGSLWRVTDARGNSTILDGYYRGVPQSIAFPDGRTVGPSADTFGQVTSVRNQLGHSTSYQYDAMGRIKQVSYPTGDSVAWAPTLSRFTAVSVDEFGLVGKHWKQEVQTGNGLATTYFDARWLPVLTVTEDVARPGSKSFLVKRYDGLGREVFSAYPVGALTTVAQPLDGVATGYDPLGRPSWKRQDSELGPLVTQWDYLQGFVTKETNPRGYATRTYFQAFDTPSTELPVRIEAPKGVLTLIDRDDFGKPRAITRSGPIN